MGNKKTLAVTVFALLLSQQSFASDIEGLYFGGGHYNQFFNDMDNLKAKIGGSDAIDSNFVSINDVGNSRTKGQFLKEYKPNYNPIHAENMTFGYEGELNDSTYRVELEGMHSSIKVDNVYLQGNQISISYIKDIKDGEETKKYGYGAKISHNKIQNISMMANAYHYWKSDRLFFSPYVGAGIGVTRMKMFEKTSIRPVYQLKAGLDYHINEGVSMHIGYRHIGVIGSNFELEAEEIGQVRSGETQSTLDTTVHSRANVPKITENINIGSKLFSTHGIEAGLTFHLASKA